VHVEAVSFPAFTKRKKRRLEASKRKKGAESSMVSFDGDSKRERGERGAGTLNVLTAR